MSDHRCPNCGRHDFQFVDYVASCHDVELTYTGGSRKLLQIERQDDEGRMVWDARIGGHIECRSCCWAVDAELIVGFEEGNYPSDLSPEARRVLGHLLKPEGDIEEITATDGTWEELRAAFPVTGDVGLGLGGDVPESD